MELFNQPTHGCHSSQSPHQSHPEPGKANPGGIAVAFPASLCLFFIQTWKGAMLKSPGRSRPLSHSFGYAINAGRKPTAARTDLHVFCNVGFPQN
jgi:hypothetical protein